VILATRIILGRLVRAGHITCLYLCSNYFHSLMAVQSKQAPPKQLTPLGSALAGALGGCFSNAYAQSIAITGGCRLNECS
jgi:hypothetical protein